MVKPWRSVWRACCVLSLFSCYNNRRNLGEVSALPSLNEYKRPYAFIQDVLIPHDTFGGICTVLGWIRQAMF